MRFLLIRNEESVRDVADKAYKGLTVKAREQAEVALLKANPELKTFKSVRKGFIIRVPVIRDDGKEDRRNVVDPIEDIAHEMSESLQLLDNLLTKSFAKLENRQKDIVDKLKAGNKELKIQPGGDQVAKALRKHLADSKKSNAKKKKLGHEALEKLQKTASAFDH